MRLKRKVHEGWKMRTDKGERRLEGKRDGRNCILARSVPRSISLVVSSSYEPANKQISNTQQITPERTHTVKTP